MQFNVFIQRIAQWIVGRSRLKLGSIRNLIENVDTGSNFAIIFHVLSMQEFIRSVPLIPTGDWCSGGGTLPHRQQEKLVVDNAARYF
jgi:hypothetical protein